jgi:periplasmic divalent cation tolerance protein
MEDPAYGVVLVTVASSEQGKKIAHALVRDQLAACVNIFPIESVYMWQGEVDRGLEHQLIIKTDLNKFSELAQKIKTLHDYEVPEIIALPIVTGSKPYLHWLGENLKK